MKAILTLTVAVYLFLIQVPAAPAQTADDVIEKSLAAQGGRAALGKLTSRSMTGTVTMSTPAGDVSGTIEVMNKAPNKSRNALKLDLSALNLGVIAVDQRFDGKAGYVLDSFQGDRDITGAQLDLMKSGAFPSPLLNYKESGATVQLSGREKVGDRDTYVLVLQPKTGPAGRIFIDAQSYLLMKTAVKVDVPQLGEIEQTSEFSDYRAVDGIQVPFQIRNVSPAQTLTVKVSKVEHNVPIDDALFSKPAGK